MKFLKLLLACGFTFSFVSPSVSASTKTKGETVVLDVRTPEEYSESHVKEAVNVDFLSPAFKSEIEKLDRNKDYVLYCRSGNRSSQAVKVMKSMGFKNLQDLGSVSNASKVLKIPCEGKTNRC